MPWKYYIKKFKQIDIAFRCIDFSKIKEYKLVNTYTSSVFFKASVNVTFFDSSLETNSDLCLSELSLSCN